MNERNRSSIVRAIWVLLASVLVPIVPFVLIGELPSERWMALESESAFRFGATGAALLAMDVLLPVPSSIVGAMLGGRLGFAVGAAWASFGLCLGAAIGYSAGRLVPARFAAELPRAPTLAIVFLSRPVPVLAEAVAIAAGVERMPISGFAASALLGNLVYAGAMAANGAALLPQGLAGPGLIVPMAVPVVGYLVFRLVFRR